MKFTDLTGLRFGRVVVVRRSNMPGKNAYWWCRCDCGQERPIATHHLKRGVPSCGCYRLDLVRAALRTHGQRHGPDGRQTVEYTAWISMKDRCYNTASTPDYADYGGRGIRVCDRWRHSFSNFFEDMGRKPSNMHSLDRINNDGPYDPTNCRWATKREQALNRRPKRR